MRSRWLCAVAVLAVLGAIAGGCTRTHRAARPAAVTTPLPDWAPKTPSPEFLRAAKVLGGVPAEALEKADMPAPTRRALLGYLGRINPPLWELFGSLTDPQMERFLMERRISLSVRELTAAQAVALGAVLDANKGEAVEISGVNLPDFRTMLYKMGARKDLSNVTIGFTVEGASTMSLTARVQGLKDPLQWTGWAQVPRLTAKSAPAGEGRK